MPAKNYANTIGDRCAGHRFPVEDGQSGYRSPRTFCGACTSGQGYDENEILIKAAPRVRRFAAVPVRTIYGVRSHYRPFRDTWITSWLSVYYKTLDSDAS